MEMLVILPHFVFLFFFVITVVYFNDITLPILWLFNNQICKKLRYIFVIILALSAMDIDDIL